MRIERGLSILPNSQRWTIPCAGEWLHPDIPYGKGLQLSGASTRLHCNYSLNGASPWFNVGELAQAAGVARGTVYNNLTDADGLFSDVATQLSSEMSERIRFGIASVDMYAKATDFDRNLTNWG